MRRLGWLLLGAALAGTGLFAHWAGRPHPRAVAVERAEPEAPVPYRERASAPAAERLAPPARAAWPARPEGEHRSADVVDGVLQIGPIRRGPPPQPRPPEPAKTAATWATDYSVAMCECQSRACAKDLQGRFIRALGAVEYDEQRDAVAYREAVNQAIECYLRLPEDT